MTEAGYVELPIIGWLCGEPEGQYANKGLGWAYRNEESMAAFDRPLDDCLVEKLLIEGII
ncbi:MAG: hypothetical protein HYY46_21625, partial [Deltaproteobacteria bacterium]|nr:hypothetical protein [Deltaproteobacteria bacterium]